MDKTVPQVQILKKKYVLNKDWILKCTFTSEDAYHTLQFNTAVAWLRHKVIKDDDVINKILSHPLFKVWWINQWNIREEDFICGYVQHIVDGRFEEFLKYEWLKIHEPERIQMHPPLKMLDDVLAEVKGQLESEVRHA